VAVTSVLCIHALALGVVAVVATRDPSFAVEPNAYAKALDWDSSHAQRLASERLGWSAQFTVAPLANEFGERKLSCRIIDRAGNPVAGATVALTLFHLARAAHRFQVSLKPEGNGDYSATVPMRRLGLWELRLKASRGASLFTTVVTQQVGAST
jgi:nitrogen fixation protein FixH